MEIKLLKDVPKTHSFRLIAFYKHSFYPWQRTFMEWCGMGVEEGANRLVYDACGSNGKSVMIEYMQRLGLAFEMPLLRTRRDVALCASNIEYHQMFVVDMMRGARKDNLAVFYSEIAKLENVTVFTNAIPNRTILREGNWESYVHQKLCAQMSDFNALNLCHYCDETAATLKHCSLCRSASYCSRKCQKSHWNRGHMARCESLAKRWYSRQDGHAAVRLANIATAEAFVVDGIFGAAVLFAAGLPPHNYELVIKIMLAFPNDPTTQLLGVNELRRFVRSDKRAMTFARKLSLASASLAIVKSMAKFCSYEPLQSAGCRAIGKMCVGNRKNAELMAAFGGVDQIVAALQCHPTNARLQRDAFSSLQIINSYADLDDSIVSDISTAIHFNLRAHVTGVHGMDTLSGWGSEKMLSPVLMLFTELTATDTALNMMTSEYKKRVQKTLHDLCESHAASYECVRALRCVC